MPASRDPLAYQRENGRRRLLLAGASFLIALLVGGISSHGPGPYPGLVVSGVLGSIALVLFLSGADLLSNVRLNRDVVTALAGGVGLLASWRIPEDAWRLFAARELEAARSRAAKPIVISTVVAIVALAVAVPLAPAVSAKPDVPDRWATALLIAAVWVTVIAILVIAIYLPARDRAKSSDTTVLFSKEGAFFAGAYHAWNSAGNYFGRAAYHEGPPPVLEVTYFTHNSEGVDPETILRIPVAPGAEKAARKVLEQMPKPKK